MRRSVRIGLLTIAGLLILVVVAGVVAILRFHPNSLKPRVVAAVQRATGRQLVLKGPISLHPSLWPTVELHDVALANPPGFSRPEMATIGRLDVQLALWPLLSRQVEIDRLVLVDPDIRLETNAQGRDNWMFGKPAAEPAAAPATAAPSAPSAPRQSGMQISVNHLRISGGVLSYRDDASGRSKVLAVRQFDADADSARAPMHVTMSASYQQAPFTLTATLGSIDGLLATSVAAPWPVQATLQTGGAKLSVDGSMRQPLLGKGYDVALIGNVPDLSALSAFAPQGRLPPVHDLRFTAKLADKGGSLPQVSMITLHVGASDLGTLQPGLQLASADVSEPSLGQPMQVQVKATLGSAPLQLGGTVGPASALLAASRTPFPVDLTGNIAGARLGVKGAIAEPAVLRGVDLRLEAQVPDLAALGPIVHRPLPRLGAISFAGRLTDLSTGLAKGVALHDLTLTMPAADLTGELSARRGAPVDVTANLAANKIDADALLAAFSSAQPHASAESHPAAPGAAPAAPPPAPPASGPHRLFPDTPLPFGLLHAANADISLKAKEVKSGGATYRAVVAHLRLQDGRLQLDPFTADSPEGHVALNLSAADTHPAPSVALTLQAPAVAVAPLLAALHQPAYASGNMEVRADLHGAGASPHAIAAGLDGTVGLAMAGGTVDAQLLQKLLGPALARANLLSLLGQGGTSRVECFAFRMDAQHGVGEVKTLVLNSSLLSLDGSGSVNLGAETLSLLLRPQGRVGGAGFVVPIQVSGSIEHPSVSVNTARAATSDLGSLAAALAGGSSPLAALGGGQRVGGGEACAGPLAIARGQQPPKAAAAPVAQPSAQPAPKPKPPNPANLLRQLFH